MIIGSLSCALAVWTVFFLAASYLNNRFALVGTQNPLSILFDPFSLAVFALVSGSSFGIAYVWGRRKWAELYDLSRILLSFGSEWQGQRTEMATAERFHDPVDVSITVAEKLPAWTANLLRLKLWRAVAIGTGVLLALLCFTWTSATLTLLTIDLGAALLLALCLWVRASNQARLREVIAWMRAKESEEELVGFPHE